MIENTLERIANALERLVGMQIPVKPAAPDVQLELPGTEATTAEAPKPRGRKPKTVIADDIPAVEPVKAITPEDIAADLRIFVTKNGKEKAIQLLKRFGATRISEIKPEDFEPVVAAMKAATGG